jgi:hypothetical protein
MALWIIIQKWSQINTTSNKSQYLQQWNVKQFLRKKRTSISAATFISKLPLSKASRMVLSNVSQAVFRKTLGSQ